MLIQEASNMETLKLENLVGSLKARELKIAERIIVQEIILSVGHLIENEFPVTMRNKAFEPINSRTN